MCGGTRPEGLAAPPTPSAVPATAAPIAPPPLAVTPATPYAVGRSTASASIDDLVYPNEAALFPIAATLSIAFWLVLLVGTFGIALLYALAGFVFYLFAQSGLIAYIKGNAIRLTPQQYPDLHQKLFACCQRLGIGDVPETFLLHHDGGLQRVRHALPGAQLPGALLGCCGRARGTAGSPQLLPGARARPRAPGPPRLAPRLAPRELPAAARSGLPPRLRIHLRQLRGRVLRRRRGRSARARRAGRRRTPLAGPQPCPSTCSRRGRRPASGCRSTSSSPTTPGS